MADIIRNIIRDIVHRSAAVVKTRNAESVSLSPQNQTHIWQITETLAAFVVRSVVLDPRADFNVEKELHRDEVERLIGLCVDRITATDDITMITVKMQLYFDTNFPAQADFLHKEKNAKKNAAISFLREITEVQVRSVPAFETLYRKVVSYVMVRAELGAPTDAKVVRESTAALESVFPQAELAAFVSLPRIDKETQLNGLVQLVSGIRLFNKELGKGGVTIDNVQEMCIKDLKSLVETVAQIKDVTADLIQIYTALMEYAACNADAVDDQTLEIVRQGLCFRRQLFIHLEGVTEQLNKSQITLDSISEKYCRTIQDLKTICRMKTAVPVDQVYPNFIILSHLWADFKDELFCLAFRRGILETLQQYSNDCHLDIPGDLLAASVNYSCPVVIEMLSDEEIVQNATDAMVSVSMTNKSMEVVHPGNSSQFKYLSLEFAGFCPVSLVEKKGMAVPGDKNLGIVRHKDKLYVFANADTLKAFIKRPDLYTQAVIDKARECPELVQLLQLYSYFPTVEALESARSYTRQRALGHLPMSQECGAQTDTHIIESHIDPKYQWNEWQLRRQALMLVNLRTKATHSTQTQLSHYKRDGETQIYLPKIQTTQTNTESATQIPKKIEFMAGLRNDGKGSRKFKVVDLTLDL